MSGKVIRLHSQDEGPGATVSFDMAIVPGWLHARNPVCPYCESKDDDYVIDYIDIKKSNRSVDIIQCAECEEAYLVVEQPALLEAKEPIFTKWHVVDEMME
jgi:hypothetical protein